VRGLVVASACVVLVSGLQAGCSAPLRAPSVSPSGGTATTFACVQPSESPLPQWARDGFSPPDQSVAHLLSSDGHIVAVPFGWPLRERQPEGRSNKILWVADRNGGGPMTIDARRDSDSTVVHRELPDGPGPSIVDLPGRGCWQLDLAWPGGRDRIYLQYLGPAA